MKNKRYPARGNLSHLLEDFMDLLQNNTSSSVHTVLNTADKLTTKHQYLYPPCIQCLGPKDQLVSLLEVDAVHQYLPTD